MPPVPQDPLSKMTASDDLPWEEDEWDYGDDYVADNSQISSQTGQQDQGGGREETQTQSVRTVFLDTSKYQQPVVHDSDNLYIAKACITGFATNKDNKKSDKIPSQVPVLEMAFIIEVTWSDGKTHAVKRTFNEFCNFHYSLVEDYAKSCSSITEEDSPLTLSLYLPGKILYLYNKYTFS